MEVKLDDVTPPSIRPTASHHRLGAIAISRKSSASPATETRITGRRPNRSDSDPMTGEQRNCIPAHSATNSPFHIPAALPEPDSVSTSCGSTGMTIPIDITSSSAVTNMKAIAALPRWDGRGDMMDSWVSIRTELVPSRLHRIECHSLMLYRVFRAGR